MIHKTKIRFISISLVMKLKKTISPLTETLAVSLAFYIGGVFVEGCNSVVFHNGYASDNSIYSACDAPGAQYSVSDSTIETISVSLSISVSGGYDTVSGDMSMIVATGTSTSFTYTFPAYGVWEVTFLGNGYPSALAFDYLSSNSGCTP